MAGTSNLEQFSALAVITFTSAQHSNMHIQIQQPFCNLIQLSNAKQFYHAATAPPPATTVKPFYHAGATSPLPAATVNIICSNQQS
jgi:hypothetical protein